MNEKEIIERYAPRKVDSQQEYDRVFELMNAEQTELNQPYEDMDTAMAIELSKLEDKRLIIAQRLELNRERKEINRPFHELKHEWAGESKVHASRQYIYSIPAVFYEHESNE